MVWQVKAQEDNLAAATQMQINALKAATQVGAANKASADAVEANEAMQKKHNGFVGEMSKQVIP